MNKKINSFILCGGNGSRLWPLSREVLPKQFIPLVDGQSLFALSIDRVKSLGPIFFIANENHRFHIQEALQNFSQFNFCNYPNIILEPEGRNTCAAIACSALMPNIVISDLLLFIPSDHFIPDVDLFVKAIHSGITAAEQGNFVTYGVDITFPNTAYGYIERGEQITFADSSKAYAVKSFIEKPNVEVAEKMFLSQNFLWNSGIFLCKASVLLGALEKFIPDIFHNCRDAMGLSMVDGNFLRPNLEKFLNCRAESIDYAILEKSKNLVVIPFQGTWSDVGSWNSVSKLTDPDKDGNRILGQGLAIESNNTYINAPFRTVVSLGTEELIIVDTPDAVLVSSVDKVEQVKNVVNILKKTNFNQVVSHRKVPRPWGWYDSLVIGDNFQVKHILVKPGASLSLQKHNYRAEHWIVVKGTAKVTIGESNFLLQENQSTFIGIGIKHRLENPGDKNLEMIEVQSGTYLGEDDIERFEDNYGRA